MAAGRAARTTKVGNARRAWRNTYSASGAAITKLVGRLTTARLSVSPASITRRGRRVTNKARLAARNRTAGVCWLSVRLLALHTAVANAKLSVKKTAARWRTQTWTRQTYMHPTDRAAIAEVVMWPSQLTLSASDRPSSWAANITGVLNTPGAIGNSDTTRPPVRTNHQGMLSRTV